MLQNSVFIATMYVQMKSASIHSIHFISIICIMVWMPFARVSCSGRLALPMQSQLHLFRLLDFRFASVPPLPAAVRCIQLCKADLNNIYIPDARFQIPDPRSTDLRLQVTATTPTLTILETNRHDTSSA